METPVSNTRLRQSAEDFNSCGLQGPTDSLLSSQIDAFPILLRRKSAQYEELWSLRKNFIFDESAPSVPTVGQVIEDNGVESVPVSPFAQRLKILKPDIVEIAQQRWGNLEGELAPTFVEKIENVVFNELCYLVGIVYIDQSLKAEALSDFTKEHWVTAPPPRYIHPDEGSSVSIEDESGQIGLTGDILKGVVLVSGVAIGILGIQKVPGEIEVMDICLPKLSVQGAPTTQKPQESKYIALISGLNIGDDKASTLNLDLLKDYLCGHLGSVQEQIFSSRIVRAVFAGNSLAKLRRQEVENKPKSKIHGQSIFNGKPVKELDMFLEEICECIAVDVMPGAHDPANAILPQQPMHFALFERAQRFFNFNSVTNPHYFKVEGITFLGNSGQTIDDLLQLSEFHDRLQTATQTLKWRLIDPTGVPPENSAMDPFVIHYCPHVYFFGNQPQFETTTVQGTEGQTTRIVLLPAFSQTHTIVLVNLDTLECHPIKFECSLDSS